jgi:hypothetical protein
VTLVEDRLTPLSIDHLISALADGYRIVLGSDVEAPCLAVLTAQSCLETGNGQKVHNWNFGNKKKPKDWDGLYAHFKCDEIFDAPTAKRAQKLGPCVVQDWRGGPLKRVVLLPPHPWSAFVAFATAAEGMADHVKLLACVERYRAAWSRAFHGDAAGFAHALRVARYYTADEEPYTAGLVSIAKRVEPACVRLTTGEHGLTDEERAHVEDVVARTLVESLEALDAPDEPDAPDGAADTEPPPEPRVA